MSTPESVRTAVRDAMAPQEALWPLETFALRLTRVLAKVARWGRSPHLTTVRAAVPVLIAASIAGAASAQERNPVVGGRHEVVVERGDTLRTIGSRHGVDPAVIAVDNRIAVTKLLAIGQRLDVDGRHIVPTAVTAGAIVVNVPQRMLFLGGDGGVRAWPVAAGKRSWPTPLGPFLVLTREEHPTWDVPASIQEEARRAGHSLPAKVPPGPANPLGDYWLGLSLGSVGIHGTNAPSSIYQTVTHGCIRMQADNIAQLFGAVRVGTGGAIIYEPVLVARDGDVILLEVHPDVYRRGPVNILDYVRTQIAGLAAVDQIDWARVAAVISERAGIPRAVNTASLR